ncbi:MAG TPA: bifunctional lysylphosphatidylglycerol flippase/synthetase MprF, partial [Longimicrobiaceae bacterium]|nr:bifunctional lysylphosphatidylglycerol flippase/synthetase MprF [Longimicrobiaceae bacterium]
MAERKRLNLHWLHRLSPLIGVGLFGFALWLLHHELRNYHYADLVRVLKALPRERLWLAVGMTVVSYAVLTLYDALGVRYVRRKLSYGRIAMASLVGYGVSMTLGFPLLTGAPLRYRMYSRWGLSAGEIARIIAFYSTTFWLGLLAVGGFALLIDPPPLPPELAIDPAWVRPIGAVLLALLTAYLVLSALGTRMTVRGFRVEMPSLGIAVAQVLSSSLDWFLAAAVLFVLLPQGSTSYAAFFTIFVVGQSAGHASHVPGGLGVFESVVLVFLSPRVPAPEVLAALLAWRAIYYLLPLLAAVVTLAAHELRRVYSRVGVPEPLAEWFAALGPQVLAMTTFVAGAILLFSGATPAEPDRIARLHAVIPLPVTELAHLLASVAGAGLLVVARGLQMRLAAGWRAAAWLLVAGLVLSLLKGLDYEEAAMLAVALAAVLPSRRRFHRRAALLSEPFTPGWVVAVAVVMVAAIWVGVFAYKLDGVPIELLWRMDPAGDAPRFLRASLGAVLTLAVYGAAHLLHPGVPEPHPPTPAELADARRIVGLSPRAEANAALLGDKSLLFNPQRTAFLMYGTTRRAWVALGDPVGPAEEHEELAWRFKEEADRRGLWAVFHHASEAMLPFCTEMGLPAVPLGEDAIVRLDDFSLADEPRRRLRRAYHDLRRRVTAEVVPPEHLPALIPELKRISDAWLARRHAQERRFSAGRFDPEALSTFPHVIARVDGKVVAFATVWPGAPGTELAVDLARHSREAPPNVLELLLVELIRWGREQGYRELNLGMAPLEEAPGAGAPSWNRLGALVFRHGEHFPGIHRLRRFKE